MQQLHPELFKNQTVHPHQFTLIAGPCVVENDTMVLEIAEQVAAICNRLQIPYIFKASYRKANRTSASSFTGIGDEKALSLIADVKKQLGLPVTTDIHASPEAALAAQYVDILQIPAILCRQNDILNAAAATGKIVNVKKGQFLSGPSMKFAVDKIRAAGNQ